MMKNMSEKLTGTGRSLYLAGLGVVATLESQSKGIFEQLVNKGKSQSEKKVSEPGKLRNLGHKWSRGVQNGVATVLGRFGLPTHQELQALTLSVEKLTVKVANLNPLPGEKKTR